MSHFTVLVVGDDVDSQMIPFQQNNMGDCPEEHLEFTDREAEWQEEYNNETIEMIQLADGSYKYSWDQQFRKPSKDIFKKEYVYPQGSQKVVVGFKVVYPTFEEFVKEYHGCEDRDNKTGRFGYWENPNAKWDWYEVGGRWAGFFDLKSGHKVSQATKGEIDFEKIKNEAGEHAAKVYDLAHKLMGDSVATFVSWEKIRDEQCKGDIKLARGVYNAQPAVKALRTKEGFENFSLEATPSDFLVTREEYIQAARDSAIQTFAILNNGKWIEKGQMGSFAVVTDEKDRDVWNQEFTKLLDGLPDDTLLTVVDCHI